MPTPRKITAAITLLQSAGYTITPPVDSNAVRAKRKKRGPVPTVDAAMARALRGPDDAPLHTMQEIADMLGCSVPAVQRALARTR